MAIEMRMHRFPQQYRSSRERLFRSQICDADKQSIDFFLKDCQARGIGLARLTKLVQTLVILAETLGKPFDSAREQDIKDLVRHFEEGEYSQWRRHDVKVIIKQYFAWLNKGVYPASVAWICTTIPKHEKRIVTEGQLLTPEEVNRVIEACDHPRNKALVAVLSESGARISEIGNLLLYQVNIDPNGIVITVDGKTGSRRIRLISSGPHLIQWLNIHPERQNPHAQLWINVGANRHHKPMTYEGIRKLLQQTFERAKVNKRCNPHIFRHTRACQLAHHLTEFQMNAYFGWAQGSDMPATYVHISGKDLDEHLLRINGLRPSETPIYKKPENRICPRCKEVNPPQALYCGKCAEIVDPTLSLKTQVENTKPIKDNISSPFGEWVLNDPEIKAMMKYKAEQYKEAHPKIMKAT